MSVEQRIRERGAVLDMAFTQSIYGPLLQHQRRDSAEVVRDVRYGEDARHRLDVYRPATVADAPRPMLVFLHGGGFVRGDKADRENVGQYFARHGFVVFVPNYRLAPQHVWPAGAEDVISVYLWAKREAATFGADPNCLFLAGESAGAAHVALATLVKRFHPKEGLKITGVILISGVYNVHLEKLARRQFSIATPDPRNEAYFGTDFQRYPSMSTIDMIDAAEATVLITYAELDMMQMQVQAGELFSRLVTVHACSPELRVVRGHNHLTQTYSINTGDEALGSLMLEFLGKFRTSGTL